MLCLLLIFLLFIYFLCFLLYLTWYFVIVFCFYAILLCSGFFLFYFWCICFFNCHLSFCFLWRLLLLPTLFAIYKYVFKFAVFYSRLLVGGCYNDSFCISPNNSLLEVNKNIAIILFWIDMPKFTQIHI